MISDTLQRMIDHEKEGWYLWTPSDKIVLQEMLDEINNEFGTSFKYFAEVDYYMYIADVVVVKYLDRFDSEFARAKIMMMLNSPKVLELYPSSPNDIVERQFNLYLHFRESIRNGVPYKHCVIVDICASYETVLYKVARKSLAKRMVGLIDSVFDFYTLPLRKIAKKWRFPEMEEVAYKFLTTPLDEEAIGWNEPNPYHYNLQDTITVIQDTALMILCNYPSKRNKELIEYYHSIKSKKNTVTPYALKRIDELAQKLGIEL